MVSGKHKSRTYKRVKVKTPSGKVVTHYRKRLPKKPKCGSCGKELHGVPRQRPFKMQQLPKTKKRPERPYAGTLCANCLKQKILDSLE